MATPPQKHQTGPSAAQADALVARGLALHKTGKVGAAAACYREALHSNPTHPEGLRLLGVALAQMGRFAQAVPILRATACVRPDDPATLSNLAAALWETRAVAAALGPARQAVRLAPGFADARQNLGAILHDLGRLEVAQRHLAATLALQPDHLGALISLGAVLRDLGAVDLACRMLRRAVALAPRHGEAHWTLATTLLVSGRLREGWAEFEWRWQRPGLTPRRFRQPRWTGGPLAGKTVLLHAEQGRGDSIQFVRYAPLLRERGARVLVQVQAELTRLFRTLAGVEAVLANADPLPPFDLQVPLMSLPGVFGTGLDTIPATVPYLHADPAAVSTWQDRLASLPRPRIGLVWAGTPTHRNDHNRSIAVESLRPLLAAVSAGWVSLQMGPRRADLRRLAPADTVLDLAPHLTDFAETAAALTTLDLVITVDTAVAHLAGALDRPAWVLLPFAPDWRWLRDRPDTPWYPSLRLFRQTAPGDWAGGVEAVRLALAGVDSHPGHQA